MAYTDEMLVDDSAAGRKGDPAAGSVDPDTEVQVDDCSKDPTPRNLVAEQSTPALLDVDSYRRPRAGALVSLIATMSPDPTKVHDALEDLREIVGERVRRELRTFQERVDTQFQTLKERSEEQLGYLREYVDIQVVSLREYVDAQVASAREYVDAQVKALREVMDARFEAQERKLDALGAEIKSLRRENRLILALVVLLVTLRLF